MGRAKADQFDAVIVPGGWAPDKLRRYDGVCALVREAHEQGKVVASICHGGLVLISAGIVRARRVTGSLGIKDDLVNAGASYSDKAVVVDRNFVSSRRPDDLPQFCRGIFEVCASIPTAMK